MLWIISVSNTVLPTPAPPNRPALPPRSSGIEHVDDLDARLEDLGLGGTPAKRRRGAMNGAPLDIGRRRLAVDGVAENVEHPRENSFADRRLQRPARVLHRHAAREALRGGQRDPAHAMRIELS